MTLQGLLPPFQRERLIAFLGEHHALYERVSELYQECARQKKWTAGHPPDHDITVASFALAIGVAEDCERSGILAAAAGLMHSYDRLGLTESDLEPLITLLPPLYAEEEIEEIQRAVSLHAKSNKAKFEGELTAVEILADADKLANSLIGIIMRTGQFLPNVPCWISDSLGGPSPGAKFHHENCALDNLYYVLEWSFSPEEWYKSKLARRITRALETDLRGWIATHRAQLRALGVA